jgi:hypothetical protein
MEHQSYLHRTMRTTWLDVHYKLLAFLLCLSTDRVRPISKMAHGFRFEHLRA